MATSLNKVITRNADNTINTSTNYSELNVKASNLTNNLVTHLEAQITTMEGAMQAKEGAVDVKIASLASVGTSTYTTPYLDRSLTMLSKAEFNAVAAERRANRAGSGFDEFGLGSATTTLNINEGMITFPTTANFLALGRTEADTISGTSKTRQAYTAINGVISKLAYTGLPYNSVSIYLPPAPTVLPSTATLTQQQIDSGVIKHADASNSGLISNGKFDTDTSWVKYGTSTISGGVYTSQLDTSGSTYQEFQITAGKSYTFEYYLTILSGTPNARVLVRKADSTVIGAQDTTVLNSSGRVVRTFVSDYTGTVRINLEQSANSGQFTIDNIAGLPADAISRSDLVFLKKNIVDISVNDFYYPLGNRQFLGTTADGLSTVAGAFASAPTYSLFSDVWQADSALVGKGFVWSTLSDVNKKTVLANPENNAYLDGDKIYQAQYIAQVAMMKGDNFTESTAFTALGYTVDSADKGLYKHADGSEAIAIALVHRRNQGMMHPVYNPNGTKLASDSLPWYSTTVSFTSIADCFTDSKLLTASGYIGTTTGRADGIFYDQVHEGDITDLRMSSKVPTDYNRLIDKEFNRLVAGTYRGTEVEWNTAISYGSGAIFLYDDNDGSYNISFYIPNYTGISVGDIIYISYYNGSVITSDRVVVTIATPGSYIKGKAVNISAVTVGGSTAADGIKYVLYSYKSTRTKSNTITHTDIIGSPANYSTVWKQSGVSGTPLIVAEDGASLLPTGTTGSDGLATFKLSRKANATPLQVLKSTDSGVTWTALTVTTHYTFSTTTNAITFTAGNIPLVADLIRVTYQTHTNMAVAAVNSEVLAIGDVFATSASGSNAGGLIHQSLTGKCGVYASSLINYQTIKLNGYSTKVWYNNVLSSDSNTSPTTHGQITLTSNSNPAVKVFPYLTRSNGKAYLQLVFKEMKYGSYAAPTVVTAAVNAYILSMTYKINIAGCALDGMVVQWITPNYTAAVDWSLVGVRTDNSLYILADGTTYTGAILYDGDSWGDNSKFNIVDNVSTTADTNGATVLIGQKRVELNYFIGASE